MLGKTNFTKFSIVVQKSFLHVKKYLMSHSITLTKLGLSLGSFALASAIDPTGGIFCKIIEAISGNLASNFVAKYDPEDLLKYLNNPNPELNHDIENLMISSVPKAVELVALKYLEEYPYNDNFVDITLKKLIEDSRIKDYTHPIEQAKLGLDRNAWLTDLHDYIFLNQQDEDGRLYEIEVFFKENLEKCYNLVFYEGMKDEKNPKPLKAFLIKSLEGIIYQTNTIENLQTKILDEIKLIKSNKNSKNLKLSRKYFENAIEEINQELKNVNKKLHNIQEQQSILLLSAESVLRNQEIHNSVLERIEDRLYEKVPSFDLFTKYNELKMKLDKEKQELENIKYSRSKVEKNIIKDIDTEILDILKEKDKDLSLKQMSLEDQISMSEQELITFEENIKRLTLNFYKNETTDSTRLQIAKKLFIQGDIEGADATLSDDDLQRDKVLIEKADQYLSQKRQILAKEFITKAELVLIRNNSNFFADANQYYKSALELFESDETCFDYAVFLQNHNQHTEAINWYYSALKYISNNDIYKKLSCLNNLAILHHNNFDYENAEKEYKEVLKLSREISKLNSEEYSPSVASALHNLADFYNSNEDYDNAEEGFEKAIKIYRLLANDNPNVYYNDIAKSMINLAIVQFNKEEYSKAESYYKEILYIYEKFYKSTEESYMYYLSTALNNLGILYGEVKKYNKSESVFNKSLRIRRKLVKLNSYKYLPDLAQTLGNLAILHNRSNNFKKASEEHTETLSIYEKLAELYPSAYEVHLSKTYINLAYFYKSDKEKALEYALKAFVKAAYYTKVPAAVNLCVEAIYVWKQHDMDLAAFFGEHGL